MRQLERRPDVLAGGIVGVDAPILGNRSHQGQATRGGVIVLSRSTISYRRGGQCLCDSILVTPFSVSANREGNTTILRIVGELDIATVPDLRTAAFAELDRPECVTLAFDLSDLDFLDSTGIGSWVEIRGRAVKNGQRVVIRAVPEFVARVLEIGALSKLFAETSD
jgi:anti-sigma B factor antagonist